MYRDSSGAVKPIASNHWLPRYVFGIEDAHTANEQAVYRYLQTNQRALRGELGGMVQHQSVAKIAAELEMCRDTVRLGLRSLVAKHSIVPWNEIVGCAEARKRGDHGGTTAWRLPLATDVVMVRGADPTIGRAGGDFFVFGPGKRFLTPAEIWDWRLGGPGVRFGGGVNVGAAIRVGEAVGARSAGVRA
jgi:hypothetical protein